MRYLALILLLALSGCREAEPEPAVVEVVEAMPNIVIKEKIELYDMRHEKGDILMLGDSYIENADWDELIGIDTVNRGIGGDTIEGVINRLYQIENVEPKVCFLYIGLNPLGERTPMEWLKRYHVIITYLLVNSIEPVAHTLALVDNELTNTFILAFNDALREYCVGVGIDYIDLEKVTIILEPSKRLTDGIHLSDEAYKLWAEEIKKLLREQ